MTTSEHRVRVSDGVNLRVRLDGDPSHPPLALVNGAFLNLDSWTPALAALSEHFHVLRHDWRGTGGSDKGPRASYAFPQYADDLLALLDHFGVERPLVCGMAYGARTAARFALRHPQRLSLLALYDVSLDQPVDQALQAKGNEEAFRLREAAGLRSPRIDPAWREHGDAREALRTLTAHRDQPDPTPELAHVRHPTLVGCGRQDVNLAEAQRIAATLPNAELNIMEMTGHGSVLSRPDLFVELLVDFARRHGFLKSSR
jgi:3-oxoadipate enol-lactonase